MKIRKTLYIDREVIRKAEHAALDQDKSLSQFIEDLLKEELSIKS